MPITIGVDVDGVGEHKSKGGGGGGREEKVEIWASDVDGGEGEQKWARSDVIGMSLITASGIPDGIKNDDELPWV